MKMPVSRADDITSKVTALVAISDQSTSAGGATGATGSLAQSCVATRQPSILLTINDFTWIFRLK
jgi:hypothetical protein